MLKFYFNETNAHGCRPGELFHKLYAIFLSPSSRIRLSCVRPIRNPRNKIALPSIGWMDAGESSSTDTHTYMHNQQGVRVSNQRVRRPCVRSIVFCSRESSPTSSSATLLWRHVVAFKSRLRRRNSGRLGFTEGQW